MRFVGFLAVFLVGEWRACVCGGRRRDSKEFLYLRVRDVIFMGKEVG